MSRIILFENKQVRRVWNEEDQKWYFSVQDVIEILTESSDIKQYVKRLKSRDPHLSSNWGTICTLVEMPASDGKIRKIQSANTEGLLRIIQSIPSPKAEPFKRWLAKVGYERLEEIADYVLFYKGQKLAVIEAKAHDLPDTEGVGQAKNYAGKPLTRFTYSTNGRGIYQIDMEIGVDTYAYFGEPVFVYSLKEGINDGFLTPFKVRQFTTSLDDYIYTSGDHLIEGEIEETRWAQ